MITVDCHNIESIKNELLIYVADNVGAIPNLKYHEFILSPIEDGDTVDQNEVVTSIREFLQSIGEQRNFAVISKGDTVSIESVTGKTIDREQQPSSGLFSCPHCGHHTVETHTIPSRAETSAEAVSWQPDAPPPPAGFGGSHSSGASGTATWSSSEAEQPQ